MQLLAGPVAAGVGVGLAVGDIALDVFSYMHSRNELFNNEKNIAKIENLIKNKLSGRNGLNKAQRDEILSLIKKRSDVELDHGINSISLLTAGFLGSLDVLLSAKKLKDAIKTKQLSNT